MNKKHLVFSIGLGFVFFFSLPFGEGWGGAYCFAQNNNVGIGTLTPDPSALLDVDAGPSNNKGVLVPRMTALQRLAIPSPANSLLVFDTDSACFFYWNAIAFNWKSLCNNSSSSTGITGYIGFFLTETPAQCLRSFNNRSDNTILSSQYQILNNRIQALEKNTTAKSEK